MKTVLIAGPVNDEKVGGQLTHMNTFKQVFQNSTSLKIRILASSKGMYDSESKLSKALRLFKLVFEYSYRLKGVDLVHLNSTFDNRSIFRDSSLFLIAKLFGKQVILQFHGGVPSKVSLLESKLANRLFSKILNSAKRVLVLTPRQSEELHSLGVNNDELIKNYIDTDEFEIGGTNIKDFKTFKILFLGRLDKKKGIYELIDACSKLKELNINFQLDILGDGPELDLLKKNTESKGLLDRVKFRGHIGGVEKKRYMKESDVNILPSYSEGLPYSVLECLASGVPTICTRVGALPNYLEHRVNVLFIRAKSSDDIVDSVLELNKDHNLRAAIKVNSVAVAKGFSLDKFEIRYSDLWIKN